ncbi:MAG: maleylpyruvate isomerase N-terminal domain-containing protein [Chloroflexi bacterium]|nr:maleylpyruvate isomerase N-terminal domain-containing protein [Chloroflexota bacterium]
MTERTFAVWVEPIAARQRSDDAKVLEFARSLPEAAWATPGGLDGWTCKDVMAHIGYGNDQLYQQLLRQVIAGGKIDTAIFRDVDTDAENAAGVEDRRGLSPEEVIDEFEEAGEEVLDLLAQLTDDHEHLRQEDPPFILKGFMDLIDKESHSIEHLKQLRQATEGCDE